MVECSIVVACFQNQKSFARTFQILHLILESNKVCQYHVISNYFEALDETVLFDFVESMDEHANWNHHIAGIDRSVVFINQ